MMPTTEQPKKNRFQRVQKSIRHVWKSIMRPISRSSPNITEEDGTSSPPNIIEEEGTSLPPNIQIAVISSANKAAVLLEPFSKLLLKQFFIDDFFTLKKGLERKLELGISIYDIQCQLQRVMKGYVNTSNINDVLDGLADICGLEASNFRERVVSNKGAKSLKVSMQLFNKKFSNPCELTQKQCSSLPLDVLSIVLNKFEDTRQFMQNNGLIFEQLKLLAESSFGRLKLEILLKNDDGLRRLIEHDITFEKLAELNLNDFKILLTDTDSNRYAELFRDLQPTKMF